MRRAEEYQRQGSRRAHTPRAEGCALPKASPVVRLVVGSMPVRSVAAPSKGASCTAALPSRLRPGVKALPGQASFAGSQERAGCAQAAVHSARAPYAPWPWLARCPSHQPWDLSLWTVAGLKLCHPACTADEAEQLSHRRLPGLHSSQQVLNPHPRRGYGVAGGAHVGRWGCPCGFLHATSTVCQHPCRSPVPPLLAAQSSSISQDAPRWYQWSRPWFWTSRYPLHSFLLADFVRLLNLGVRADTGRGRTGCGFRAVLDPQMSVALLERRVSPDLWRCVVSALLRPQLLSQSRVGSNAGG